MSWKAVQTAATLALLLGMATSPWAEDASDSTRPRVVVEFKGPRSFENLFQVLASLREEFGEQIFPTKPVEVTAKGQTPCSFYADEFRFGEKACPGAAVDDLTKLLNGGKSDLQIGQTLLIPSVALEQFSYTIRIDDSTFSIEQGHTDIIRKNSPWGKVIEKLEDKGTSSVAQLSGQRLTVFPGAKDTIPAIVDLIFRLDLDNTNAYAAGGSTGKRPFFSHVGFSEKAKQCNDPALPHDGTLKSEGAYWTMFPSHSDWELPACAIKCQSTDIKCPQVVLMDTLVHPHPDLRDAVKYIDMSNAERSYVEDPACSGSKPNGGDDSCSTIEFDKQCHHGTSMASIIVDQPNERGFIGLAPASRLFSFDWQTVDPTSVPGLLETRLGEDNFKKNGPQIYVFASKFHDPEAPDEPADDNSLSYADGLLDQSGRRISEERLRLSPPLVAKISETRDLWIVAAGQPSDPTSLSPKQIDSFSPYAPMNLGWLDNVIVVTACDPCEGPDRKLWEGANYSRVSGIMNLAAPGLRYVTSANQTAYAKEHGGTSQATAFVGGLAAAMISCDVSEHAVNGKYAYVTWSSRRTQANQIKRRLVLTSTPIEKPAANGAVVGGIVNPALALKDPNKHWIRPRNAAADVGYSEADVSWCDTAALSFRPIDAIGNLLPVEHVQPSKTRRIRGEGQEGNRRWFIYFHSANSRTDDAEVEIKGPVKFVKPEQNLILTAEGVQTLNDFDDLVLSLDGVEGLVKCPAGIATVQ